MSDLKAAGADATVTEFPETWHAYDVPSYPPVFEVKTAQSTRNCLMAENSKGDVVDTITKAVFDYKSDACVAVGAHIGYNPASTAATQSAVLAVLKQAFAHP